MTVDQIKAAGNSEATIGLGPSASEPAAEELEEKCEVPGQVLELPIGLRATDRFIKALRTSTATYRSPTRSPTNAAGCWTSSPTCTSTSTASESPLSGDPDQLVSLAEFLVDLDMRPVYIVTGTPGKQFDERIEAAVAGRVAEAKVVYKQGFGADHVTSAPTGSRTNRSTC